MRASPAGGNHRPTPDPYETAPSAADLQDANTLEAAHAVLARRVARRHGRRAWRHAIVASMLRDEAQRIRAGD
jgi:hypothetical protein